MQLSVIKPGVFSTIQDLGRTAYLGQGVPLSGAMDQLSSILANIALGNEETEATLEVSYANAEFITDTDILLSYCGYGALMVIDDINIPASRPVFIPKGHVVKLINNSMGSRTYIAVAGGWNVPDILGSKSTYVTGGFGGLNGRTLQKGDVLSSTHQFHSTTAKILEQLKSPGINYTSWSIKHVTKEPGKHTEIRVVPGQEMEWLDTNSILSFLSDEYLLSNQANRMGLNLNGRKMKRKNIEELLSTAVVPGTIQVTGDGSLILLMADCQTTGGYPRIAQVAAVDLSLCGQLKPDDAINFVAISKEEAENLYLEQRKELYKIKSSISNRY
ncbi:MAG: biotin-dependent carboxyltransferase family protein [Pedobacter sp.]|nr:MAG: biotin-dependent carboxyltransferase family protein [Pedobacter sp.]